MSRHFSKNVVSFAAGIFCGLAGMATADAADVSLSRAGDEIVISAAVQADFAGSEAVVLAPDAATIEVSVAGADFSVDGKRQLFRFEDQAVKTVSVSRDTGKGVIRFNVKEKNATVLADLIRASRADGQLILTMPSSADANGSAISGSKTVSIVQGPSKFEAAAQGVVPEVAIKAASLTAGSAANSSAFSAKSIPDSETKSNASVEVAASPKEVRVDKRAESEIPVFVDKAEAKKASSGSLEKLVMTLFVVCALLAAALFGLKRWAARRGKNITSPTKIQILTQHHLGPKKSLAIVQVAGEAILIGITDQNISMLKTLALIDDEVPGHVPKNFADELDNDTTEAQKQLAEEGFEEDNFALKGLNEVRDIVSTRFGRSTRKDA